MAERYDKAMIPYKIITLVLKNAEMVSANKPPEEGYMPAFYLALKTDTTISVVEEIRKLIKEANAKEDDHE